jgi:hypothetical protein
MAEILYLDLQAKEDIWRKYSPDWKRKMAQYEAYLEGAKDRERKAARASKRKGEEEEKEGNRDETREWQACFRPNDPLPDFSFAGQNTSYSASELDEDIADLLWRKPEIPRWAIHCLRRGIAVHHAGMNKAYRSLVER